MSKKRHKPGSIGQKKAAITEHRKAICDYRFVWRVAPDHQRDGWRRAALTHESLVRAYARDVRGMRS